jgi:hypothetical protein
MRFNAGAVSRFLPTVGTDLLTLWTPRPALPNRPALLANAIRLAFNNNDIPYPPRHPRLALRILLPRFTTPDACRIADPREAPRDIALS